MKKNFIILTIIVYVLCCSYILFSLNGTDSVYTNNDIYGKVIVNNCYLKKTPTQINDTSNLYFLLEESYFVKVIAEENDFYYVQYLDLTGYIEKSAINLGAAVSEEE